jgi:hypothetical protein
VGEHVSVIPFCRGTQRTALGEALLDEFGERRLMRLALSAGDGIGAGANGWSLLLGHSNRIRQRDVVEPPDLELAPPALRPVATS